MTTALTENHANADFTTGLAVPSNGTDSAVWSGEVVAAFQEIVDRTQRLKLFWNPDAPVFRIPLTAGIDSGGNFAINLSSNRTYWTQTSVAGVGNVSFPLSGVLPVGRKVTGVDAYWFNANTVNVSIGTKPTISLYKGSITIGGTAGGSTLVSTVTDPTAVLGTYQTVHLISLTGLTEVIDTDEELYVKLTGETGANSTTDGRLVGLRVTLGP
jgi:hypothetical protein